MKIGIIGSGKIGGTLGTLWAQAGHQVFLSSRHPDRLKPLVTGLCAGGHEAQAGTVKQAAEFGDTLLFSPPYWQTEQALEEMGLDSEALSRKVVLDATNPFSSDGKELRLPYGTTAVSELVKQIPSAKIVKAFNTVYWQTLRDLNHVPFEERYVICYAGNESSSKQVAAHLIEDAGFIAYDLGRLPHASLMEPGGPFFNQELTLQQAETLCRAIRHNSQSAA